MTEWLTAGSRSKLGALALLLVTFVVGALAGAAATSAVAAREVPAKPAEERRSAQAPQTRGPHFNGNGGDRERQRRNAWLNDIGATEEQRAAIGRLMEERRRQIDALLKEQEPRMRTIIDASQAEIMNVLTPEQRELHERRRAEHRTRRAAERERN
jgi:Spy/CpxP family protein refolding chaperone